jgi:hypothetical protein
MSEVEEDIFYGAVQESKEETSFTAVSTVPSMADPAVEDKLSCQC